MGPKSNRENEPIRLTAHAPERGKRPTSITAASGCCCCCCCCLHTLGGLIGAITGSFLTVQRGPRPVDPSFPFPFRRDELDQDEGTFPIGVVYWLIVLGLIAVVSVGYFFIYGNTPADPWDFLLGALLALFFLPLVQLVASLFSLIIAALFYRDKRPALVRVGKITLWCFVGSLIGTLLLFGLCGGATIWSGGWR